jgi:hypothetical protein
MKTIIQMRNGLQVNIIHLDKGHVKLKHTGCCLLLGLDVEILEPNPIYREKNLFGMMEKYIHPMSFIFFFLFGNPIGSRLGLVKNNGSSCESVLHGQLIIWVDMDNDPIVR